jgi:hypothetical protein
MEKNKPTVPEIIDKWNSLKTCENSFTCELMSAMEAAEYLLGTIASIKDGLDKAFAGDYPGNTGTASLHLCEPLQKSFELALGDDFEYTHLGMGLQDLMQHLGSLHSDTAQGLHKGWDGWYDEGGYDKD